MGNKDLHVTVIRKKGDEDLHPIVVWKRGDEDSENHVHPLKAFSTHLFLKLLIF